VRDQPLPAAAPPAPSAPAARALGARWVASPRVRRAVAGLASVGLVGALARVVLGGAGAPLPAPTFEGGSRDPLAIRSALGAREDGAPGVARRVRPIQESDEVPLLDGVPLDERFPSLRGWAHPVTASAEYMPDAPPRLFGSERNGIERPECGAGHCGVDLDGPRGRPIVAVAAGLVVRIERRELGADGRSGRYVRLRHEDGTLTSYMHLDDVADELREGAAVTRGQYLGTLGATAVYSAPPHLHFALEVPRSGAPQVGDHVATRFVNPAPFLLRSTILPVIERRAPPALN
jgi:murein DD-endopeptidase MepM/ murein hydrolase activator NlpD